MLVWMDLEMTGLDVNRHVIVEMATVITDDNLAVVAEGPDLILHATEAQLNEMDDVVRTMHTKSGLLPAIRESEISLADAVAATLEFVQQHIEKPASVPLCGNSIGTDRRFLVAYAPDIDCFLHYRNIDVSTVKELCRRWFPDAYKKAPAKAKVHRALGDIHESIAELAYYRSVIFAGE